MPKYYEFEVSLQGIEPRIWRRFLLRSTSTFAQLHQAIQDCFRWEGYHLWQFEVPGRKGRVLAGSQGGEDSDVPIPDAKTVKLSTYFTGDRVAEWCLYLYDFGDDWTHEVKLVGLDSRKETFKRMLLDGAMAAPREDSGGVFGYARIMEFLETGEDPDGDEPEDFQAWIGDWDPFEYSLDDEQLRFVR